MRRIRCFLLEPTETAAIYLRRYSSLDCPNGAYHNVMHRIEDRPSGMRTTESGRRVLSVPEVVPDQDPRWPSTCECGYEFGPAERQVFQRQLWRCADTGDTMTLEEAPAGAMWFAWWLEDIRAFCGPDGRCLMVKTPGGDWMVDGRASNCTLPNDHRHKCWCRHGEAPNVTVDKNGDTCSAGAGSIAQPTYHGFLREGWLED